MKINNQLLKGLAIGLGIVGMFVLASFLYKKKNVKSSGGNSNNSNESEGKSIIIGDSQTPFITKQSKKVKMLGYVGGENVLWKGGMGLKWLKGAVSKYPVSKDVKNVVINIGTNGGFNKNDDISGLMDELKRVFPNAEFHVVKGSWGWGGNKNKTESEVNNYYQKFKDEGVNIIKTAIGSVKDPHSNLPIYKEIGKEIDEKL